MESQDSVEIMTIIVAAIEQLESSRIRSELLKGLINPPRRERWKYLPQKGYWDSGLAEGDVWVFLIIPTRPSIGFAYSQEGYALVGRRWGLVWVEHPHYGAPDEWYESLGDLIIDAGNFADGPTVQV